MTDLNIEEIVAGLSQELRRGTLIMLVLSQLKKPMYGYNLIKIFEEGGVPVEANTIYPLLRRLEAQGLLHSAWETGGAKPRKYYVLTEGGTAVLGEIKEHWIGFSEKVNLLLEVREDEQ